MATEPMLIGDIGGTNARFAVANPDTPGFSQVRKLACADYDTAEDAIEDYLSSESLATPGVICLAAAQSQIPVLHYAATQVKKILTGNGRAPKGQIQQAALLRIAKSRALICYKKTRSLYHSLSYPLVFMTH